MDNLITFNRGNKFFTHRQINSLLFFRDLKKKKINVPSWSIKKPKTNGWLIKNLRSFGGKGVREIGKNIKITKFEYYQKIIDGEHISIQFYSEDKRMKILSICDQSFYKRKNKPYLIESILSRKLDLKTLKKIQEICNQLMKEYNLNGMNNLDIVLENTSKIIYVIELNARPGLSTNFLSKKYKDLYKDNFLKIIEKKNENNFFYGTKIIYSNKNIIINKKKFKFIKSLSNSRSYSELPVLNDTIGIHEPICLIHSKSKKIEILRENLKKMSYKIYNELN